MRALEGIRVLDLSHMLSGPYCAMMLADLGADVIKVEPPGSGEGTRRLLEHDPDYSLDGMGAYYLTLNRNKRSVSLDLKSDEGLALFYDLVRESDVVLSNFSAGVVERLKIAHDDLAAVNDRIITCCITGFGEGGPHANWPAFDLVAQGVGGAMSITGEPDGTPTRAGLPIGDLGGSVMATIGVLTALQARHTTGRGQHVDISMQDAQISLLNYMATMYFLSGHVPGAEGNAHFVHVPYNTFPASDGYFIIAVIFDVFWKNLMTIVDLPSLDTPENEGQPGRFANRDQINKELSAVFATKPKAYWLEKLREARIPCAPVNNLEEALSDPQTLHRNMVVDVPHVNGSISRQVGIPIKLSDTGDEIFTAPPTVGQHTDDVLAEILHKTPAEITDLHDRGIV